jgi:hypothetical protein
MVYLLGFPIYVWVIIGTFIFVCVGITLYFFVFKKTNDESKIFETVTVIDTTKNGNSAGRIHPGDRIQINYTGTHKGSVNFAFSAEKGENFIEIGKSDGSTFTWTISPTVFSDTCVVRVSDALKSNVFLESPIFAVVPDFVVDGVGSKDGQNVLPDTNATFTVSATAWPILSNNSGFEMQVSTTGTSVWNTQKVTFDTSSHKIIWHVPSNLLDTSINIRFRTVTLISLGFPRNLQFLMPFQVSVVSDNTNKLIRGAFILFKLVNLNGSVVSDLHAGVYISFEWASTSIISRIDLGWSTTQNGQFTTLKQGINGIRGNYRFEIPSEIDTTEDVYFQIVDQSDASNYAVSSAIKVISNWSFFENTSQVFNLIMYPKLWVWSLTIQIEGFNSTFRRDDMWKTVLYFPNNKQSVPFDLTSASGLAGSSLTILNKDISRNLYTFLYLMTVPVLGETNNVNFQVGLSHNGGAEVRFKHLFIATFPARDGLLTGNPFTDVVQFDDSAEGDKRLIVLPVPPKSYKAGTTYPFIYTGSHTGETCSPIPCAGQAPVVWKVIYTDSDSAGNLILRDLLAGLPDGKNMTQFDNRVLNIHFPEDMNATNVVINVSLPRAQTIDNLDIEYNSAPFNVVAALHFLPEAGNPSPIFLSDQQNIIKIVATGGGNGGSLLWGSTSQHTFVSKQQGQTWDMAINEDNNVQLDRISSEILWTPSYINQFRDFRIEINSPGKSKLIFSTNVPIFVSADKPLNGSEMQVTGMAYGSTFIMGSTAKLSRIPSTTEKYYVSILDSNNPIWVNLRPEAAKLPLHVELPNKVETFHLSMSKENGSEFIIAGPFNMEPGIYAQIDHATLGNGKIDDAKKLLTNVQIGLRLWHSTPSSLTNIIDWTLKDNWSFVIYKNGLSVAEKAVVTAGSITSKIISSEIIDSIFPTAVITTLNVTGWTPKLSEDFDQTVDEYQIECRFATSDGFKSTSRTTTDVIKITP